MPVTISDISRKLGISASTVSKALNDYPHVAPETRNLVRQTALSMGYQPGTPARTQRRRRSERIGLLTNRPITETIADILAGVTMGAEQHGQNLIVYTETIHQPGGLARIVRSGEFDGALMAWANPSDDELHLFDEVQMPYVVLGQRVEHPEAMFVAPDNFRAAYDLTHHLIDGGHERIGQITRPDSGLTGLDRLHGYQMALRDAGLPVTDDLVVGCEPEQVTHLLALPERPTAVVAFDAELAADTLRAAYERGLHVPADMAIAAFDGLRAAVHTRPQITTVSQPLHEMGAAAVDILLQHMHDPSRLPQRRVFPVTLVVRGSSAS